MRKVLGCVTDRDATAAVDSDDASNMAETLAQ